MYTFLFFHFGLLHYFLPFFCIATKKDLLVCQMQKQNEHIYIHTTGVLLFSSLLSEILYPLETLHRNLQYYI